jgi:hypothetical protein
VYWAAAAALDTTMASQLSNVKKALFHWGQYEEGTICWGQSEEGPICSLLQIGSKKYTTNSAFFILGIAFFITLQQQ